MEVLTTGIFSTSSASADASTVPHIASTPLPRSTSSGRLVVFMTTLPSTLRPKAMSAMSDSDSSMITSRSGLCTWLLVRTFLVSMRAYA